MTLFIVRSKESGAKEELSYFDSVPALNNYCNLLIAERHVVSVERVPPSLAHFYF
jgi:hypothetical protein